MTFPSGLLLLSKPVGLLSTQVTSRVRSLVRARMNQRRPIPRVGHVGTLDPFATGLLPIAIGSGTRLIPFMASHTKSYQFNIRWGTETDTGDLTGKTTVTAPFALTPQQIEAVLPQFRGQIFQEPPCFSALKIEGKRAYQLARAGKNFTLKPRPQHITALTLCSTDTETATFSVTCDAGTYIRVLGSDIARALGTRGHLTQLTRTSVGPWLLKSAIPLSSFEEIAHDESKWGLFWVRPRDMLDDIPACCVDQEGARSLRYGQALPSGSSAPEGAIVACVQGDVLLALARVREGFLWPFRVFVEPEKGDV